MRLIAVVWLMIIGASIAFEIAPAQKRQAIVLEQMAETMRVRELTHRGQKLYAMQMRADWDAQTEVSQ